jgi:hypothetical protein
MLGKLSKYFIYSALHINSDTDGYKLYVILGGAVYSNDIYQDSKNFYIKSDNGQVELPNVMNGSWDYNYPFFNTIFITGLATEDSYDEELVDTLSNVLSGNNITFRLQGNFTVDGIITEEEAQATNDFLKLYKELYSMYMGL